MYTSDARDATYSIYYVTFKFICHKIRSWISIINDTSEQKICNY